jgi:hypothetical protein
MNFKIKDEAQLRRYRGLSPDDRAKVDQIMKQYLAACAKLDVETETDAPFREAIDMVVSGNWEPDREPDRPDPRWSYETYIPPIKEAA